MHRAFVLFCSIVCLLGFASAMRAQTSQVTVSVFSDVPMDKEFLARAERDASYIFSREGVYVVWADCTHPLSPSSNPSCLKSYGPGEFALRITSHGSSVANDAFGVAWLADNGAGCYADIFWTRAQALSANSPRNLAALLGSVMAHELGHLLLGANSHSLSGIMQARWRSSELQQAEMGNLFFLTDEGKRMRERVSILPATVLYKRISQPETPRPGRSVNP